MHAVELAGGGADVVLMDVRMPRMDGLEATRALARPSRGTVEVLVLTTFDLDEYVFGALRAGAAGFLLKDAPPEQLIDAIRRSRRRRAARARGHPPLIASFAEPRPAATAAGALDALSARELDVLLLIARGLQQRRDRRRAELGETTVKTQSSRAHQARLRAACRR